MRFILSALPQVAMPGQLVVLALMLGCGVWAAVRRGVLPLVALAMCTAMWLRANSQLEGAVLISFSPAHGLTLADLLVPALGSAVLLFRLTSTPEPDEERPAPVGGVASLPRQRMTADERGRPQAVESVRAR